MLPDTRELRRRFNDSIQRQVRPVDDELGRLEALLFGKNDELENFQTKLLHCDIPKLQRTFREIALKDGIALNARKSGSFLTRWVSGFLKPENLLKLGEIVAKYHGYP